MKIYRVKQASNPYLDLTRLDLTFLRRMAENMAKASGSLDKMSGSSSELSKMNTGIRLIATKLGDINGSIKELQAAVRQSKH